MSRRTRRHHETPFSLFSFQDVIAAVTGVVLLVTLLLMLELILRRPGVAAAAALPTPEAPLDPAAIRARLDAARRQILDAPRATAAEAAAAQRAVESLEELLAVLRTQAAAETAGARDAEQQLQRRQAARDALAAHTAKLRRQAEAERALTRVTLLEGDRDGATTWFIECAEGDVRAGRIADDGAATLAHRFASADAALQWALTRPRGQERFVLLVHPDGVAAFDTLQRGLRAAGYGVGWDLWTQTIRLFNPGPANGDGPPDATSRQH